MGPVMHIGLTSFLLVNAKLLGFNVDSDVCFATIAGGILLDADKTIEIPVNWFKSRKGKIPDITARCRILHSIFAFPFGLILSFAISSWLPFIAVLLHIGADSFIPGLEKDGKHYPSHSCRKWLANPFSQKSWEKVIIGWPITYPPKLNWIYNQLAPITGAFMTILSFFLWIILK